MGLTPEFKTFLFQLFPQCFSSELNQEIDICIKEVLPDIVPKILNINKKTNITMNQLCFQFKQSCSQIFYNYHDKNGKIKGPNTKKRLILVIDNYTCVPGNKTLTEIKRDNTEVTWLKEEDYLSIRKEKNFIIRNEMDNINGIDGSVLWRDSNFRWLINYILTRELQKISIPENKELIIDEGLFFNERELTKLKENILKEHNMNHNHISHFEKDCLFSWELKKYFKIGYFSSDGNVYYKKTLNIGEADLKILTYINRNDSNDSYLVQSPDSDLIALLLLHCKSIINTETGELENQIFIDSQTSMDKSTNNSRETRFININLLYHSINNLFKNEYKDVIYPIETLVFLFLSYFNDYCEKVHPYLSVGPAKLWNAFSFLHHSNLNKGFIVFNQNKIDGLDQDGNPDYIRIKCKIQTKPNPKFQGLLNNFLGLKSYNNTHLNLENQFDEFSINKKQSFGYFANYFVINLDEDKLISFFCFVYQQSLLPKFKKESILKTDIIYDYKTLLLLADKYELKKKGSEKVPSYCGLLSDNQLKTRIKTLQWIMNYYHNSWKSPSEFSENYVNLNNNNKNVSQYGWQLIEFNPKKSELNYSISSNYIIKIKVSNDEEYKKNKFNSIYNIYNFYIVNKLSIIEDDIVLQKLNLIID